MNRKTQQLCTWSGIIGTVLLAIGQWPLLHFVPPPLPSATAAEIAAIYRSNTMGILLGTTLMLATSAFYVPFYAAISAEIDRVEGIGSALSRAQFGLAMLAVCVPFAITADAWMIAAFRPERSDETIQMLNDFGWFLFFTPVVGGCLNALTIAGAILLDKSRSPIFPRWVAFFNIWIGILFLPGALLAFFKLGPFALNGIFVYWLGFGAFGAWFVVMTCYLLRNVHARGG